jgi:hypothetical protein
VTRDEQKAITEFVDRAVGGIQPPMDIEADAIIRALFARNPDAAYRITKLAMALSNAQLSPAERPTGTESLTVAAPQKKWLSGLFGRKGF